MAKIWYQLIQTGIFSKFSLSLSLSLSLSVCPLLLLLLTSSNPCHSLSNFRAESCTDAPPSSILPGTCNTATHNDTCFDENPFTCHCGKEKKKEKKKGWRISNFALLLVVFKWHHESDRINQPQKGQVSPAVSTLSKWWTAIASLQLHSFISIQLRKVILATFIPTNVKHWRS